MLELSNLDEIVALRRDIHMHPELCYEEHRTAKVVADTLRGWGIETHTGIAKTGVVGVIRRGTSDRAIMLRADMDALPMQEENQFDHRSRHDGKMHGCGHDGHTAMLLAAAQHLQTAGGFDGTVYLCFQPAEEGGAGGRAMIQDGLFTRFPCEAVFGMHNWPGLPAGSFGVCSGPMMAAANGFKITVKGKGGHAAAPQDCNDPVPALFAIGQSLQTILTRSKRPLDAAVLSITQVQAGGSVINVIPNSAWLGGSVRAYSTDVVDLIERRMKEIAGNIAAAHGCEADVFFERRYPALVNTVAETEFCMEVMRDVVGEDRALVIEPAMASEDFAFLLQEKPGCYVFLGNGDGEHRMAGHGLGPCMLHNASYDFNDSLIPAGASYWVRLAQRYLA
ncbi:M20 aminoacylase family protein [Achromobacter deleyi]|uniref:M20 aminoacylase family protein n=1 Tax=Achromobacter deleyi TaxID=1353891 RepID=UPI0014915EDB|nr:M20 aminoacylase family protein [Achromobacter deleyi]QVQ25371.1 amidohydrolase [Achromobacter deleyi]UIP20913.1 M20 family metallopeptidase [Achromobacter deleyi]